MKSDTGLSQEYRPLECKTLTVSMRGNQAVLTLTDPLDATKEPVSVDCPGGLMPFINALRGVVQRMEKAVSYFMDPLTK